MTENLSRSFTISECNVCGENIDTVSQCCNIHICESCYLEWLKTSRECMHCRKDQLPFDEWVRTHREDREEELPAQMLPQIISTSIGIIGPNNEIINNVELENFPNIGQFTSDDLLNVLMSGIEDVIAQTLSSNNISNNSNIEFSNNTIYRENLLEMLNIMADSFSDNYF